MSIVENQTEIFDSLADHINKHFYHSDLEALRAVLAAVHAHYAGADPVWLFVIGPSGSGKTSVAINCISQLPDVMVISDLTPKSFLVGTPDGQEKSILNHPSIIFAFKDFTTMISKRDDDQREIVATLREVYDGETSRRTATATRNWSGKCTVIAAVTPAIERAWAIHRDLGERFMQVRWLNSSMPAEVAKMARNQRGQEKQIAEDMRALTMALFADVASRPAAQLSDDDGDRIDSAATLIAKLRSHVVRDTHNGRQIIDVSAPEEPTRLAKSLATLACHHAALFGRDLVKESDMKVALRVGLDTVPSSRLRIMQAIPPKDTIGTVAIRATSGVHKNTLLWQTDELEAVEALVLGKTLDDERTCAFTDKFRDLWERAGLL